MTPGAVLCLQCGYNIKLGRRMETAAEEVPAVPAVPSATGTALSRPARAKSSSKSDRRGWIIVGTGLSISLVSLMIGAVAFAILAVAILIAVTNPMMMMSAVPRPRVRGPGG